MNAHLWLTNLWMYHGLSSILWLFFCKRYSVNSSCSQTSLTHQNVTYTFRISSLCPCLCYSAMHIHWFQLLINSHSIFSNVMLIYLDQKQIRTYFSSFVHFYNQIVTVSCLSLMNYQVGLYRSNSNLDEIQFIQWTWKYCKMDVER